MNTKKIKQYDDNCGYYMDSKGMVECDICDERFRAMDSGDRAAHSHKGPKKYNIPITIKFVTINKTLNLKIHQYERLGELTENIVCELLKNPNLIPSHIRSYLDLKIANDNKDYGDFLDSSCFRLVFNGNEIQGPKKQLRFYGITTNSMIYLVFKNPMGASKSINNRTLYLGKVGQNQSISKNNNDIYERQFCTPGGSSSSSCQGCYGCIEHQGKDKNPSRAKVA